MQRSDCSFKCRNYSLWTEINVNQFQYRTNSHLIIFFFFFLVILTVNRPTTPPQLLLADLSVKRTPPSFCESIFKYCCQVTAYTARKWTVSLVSVHIPTNLFNKQFPLNQEPLHFLAEIDFDFSS